MTDSLTPAQWQIVNAMPEAVLQENVHAACRQLRLLFYHTYRSKHSPAGFPDDVIVGRRAIYRELKRHGRDPTPEQQQWLDALAATGHDVGVWRPEDWLSGRILSELRAIT